MEYVNEIKVILSILSEDSIDCDNITDVLRVKASKTTKRGELIYPSPCILKHKYDAWQYSIEEKNVIYIENMITKIIDMFEIIELCAIKTKYNSIIQLSIIGYLKKGMPSIHFSKEQIAFFHAIGAEIDIDLYGL
jgi:hypothetical protein